MKRQTIKTCAAEISRRWPRLQVALEPWTTNTDRKIGRLRWPGKGRKGYRLTIREAASPGQMPWSAPLLGQWETGNSYFRIADVLEWIENRKRK